ncbi:hypothetical protein [Bradyrhizobium sp.]|uniref:hypothetical protein n=1 Tax=Bradyrhizobium sp. TaxID=376 RepID=UPI003C63EB2C
MPSFAQREEASHQPKAECRRFIGLQCQEFGLHRDRIPRHFGFETVNEPSLDRIIEQLQFCIVDARALQLKMLERILSIALLEAYEIRGKPSELRGKNGA